MGKYSFSGHESFFCKPLWLKKGYDALTTGVNFASPEAVAALGVGKNMVASIRFWLKAFNLSNNDIPTEFADKIFHDNKGYDPYLEDTGTLWLLHYYLVTANIASIYHLTFLEFQREKREFDRAQLQSFIKRKCAVPEQRNVYNENTVKKDIGVLLHNYVSPSDTRSIEDYSAIFIDLDLIKQIGDDKYVFSEVDPCHIDPKILLYAILDYKGTDNTISLDSMQELSLIFGLPLTGFIEVVKALVQEYPESITYNDNSGIKNIQFIGKLDASDVLQQYYNQQ